jgi:hypothetical protein
MSQANACSRVHLRSVFPISISTPTIKAVSHAINPAYPATALKVIIVPPAIPEECYPQPDYASAQMACSKAEMEGAISVFPDVGSALDLLQLSATPVSVEW